MILTKMAAGGVGRSILVWFSSSSPPSECNSTSDLLEKLTYGTVRWNGRTPVDPRSLVHERTIPAEIGPNNWQPSTLAMGTGTRMSGTGNSARIQLQVEGNTTDQAHPFTVTIDVTHSG
jgi:hypothetical protein